jgi:hypothetical protein
VIAQLPSDYRRASTFSIQRSGAIESEHLRHIAGTLFLMKAAMGFNNTNEAACSAYILPIVCLAVVSLKISALLIPQYKLAYGKAGSGSADLIVKLDEKIILTAEIKANKNALTDAVARNARQMYPAYQENENKGCYGTDESHVMRSLVSTADMWIFSKLDLCNEHKAAGHVIPVATEVAHTFVLCVTP